ncbi:Detected protein of unknown function [Hibiscus syriacus]|uniref:Post-SET domain-containing protein n=1 Tax=Hibiscus syriacus TaxID=106335 RepID=A0A6A3AHK1_HIBSY|nr:Detected protein of unknown function [Hibiscus syriacus]
MRLDAIARELAGIPRLVNVPGLMVFIFLMRTVTVAALFHFFNSRLIEATHVVFECGPNCGCGPTCVNRTSQRGLRYRLEVFRTPKKGWVVRSWDFIPSGAPRQQQDGSLPVIQNVDKITEQRSENVPDFCIDAAHVMLFAADNIPPLQELTYDYGYALDRVYGPDGKVKRMACYCGAEGCRKRLF